jgi:hypothetical protein
MNVAIILVLCVFAVLPTLAIKYTYDIKYLDVPVSKIGIGVGIIGLIANIVLFEGFRRRFSLGNFRPPICFHGKRILSLPGRASLNV